MMNRTGMAIAGVIAAALASACATTPDIAVRTVGATAPATGADRVATGRAALTLGNVGMALEQFRKALRERPESVHALAGIAQCYDTMGRGDLSRRYYQEALALAPSDTRLLRRYADALGGHGALDEAQAVIAEIALRTRAPAEQWVIEPGGRAAASEDRSAALPVETVAGGAPMRGTAKIRLERLSLGEIALVTSAAPLWRPVRQGPAAVPSPARVARLEAVPGPVRTVRLLNAARRQGLAARSAARLQQAGWRRLAIGNAPQVRSASLILHPAGQGGAARALGTRLGIAAIRVAPRTDILVLLGQDSA